MKKLFIILNICILFSACSVQPPLTEFTDTKAAIDAVKLKHKNSCENKYLINAIKSFDEAKALLKTSKQHNPISKANINNTCVKCTKTDLYQFIKHKLLFSKEQAIEANKFLNNREATIESLKKELEGTKQDILSLSKDVKKTNMKQDFYNLIKGYNFTKAYLDHCDIDKAKESYILLIQYLNSVKIGIYKNSIAKQILNEIKSYKVKKGDSLWRISKREYLNPFMWPLIYWANKASIKDPDLIFPGQIFKINKLNKYSKKTISKAISMSKIRGTWSLFDNK